MEMGGIASKRRLWSDVFFLPPLAKAVSPEAVKALEEKRAKRLRELGDWRPTMGWQIEPLLPPEQGAF